MNLEVRKHILTFSKPAKTSRDTLVQREIYYFLLREESNEAIGIGECSPIFGLSPERKETMEQAIEQTRIAINANIDVPNDLLTNNPSIRFALETAKRDLANGGERNIFPNHSQEKIPINGLVWMNEKETMLQEALEKIESGFKCIKLKIGGIQFEDEIEILQEIRKHYSPSQIEIRLDANGAFNPDEALKKLERLAAFSIHSIEQPIRAGQWNAMANLCKQSSIAIALDEELIPIHLDKQKMLSTISPQYIILKPTLHGGLLGCDEWIKLAKEQGVDWWATSALESNIGLNAIAQWINTYSNPLPQGLGTGKLYVDNIPSPLQSGSGYFWWDKTLNWQLNTILQ